MTEHPSTEETAKPTIEHLVLSGGDVGLLAIYGVLRESAKSGFWRRDNIKSIWGTSAGAIVAGFVLLTTDWDSIDSYLIRRPWDKVFPINLYTLMNAYGGCGLFSVSALEQMFSPLLLSCDFPVNITLSELYDITGVDLHVFTTEINIGQCVDISHTTHPSWRLIDAVYASCSLPGLFKPLFQGENTYTDGSLFCHYPLKPCLDKYAAAVATFGIVKHIIPGISETITSNSTLLNFIGKISYMLFESLLEKQFKTYVTIPYEIDLGVLALSAEGIQNAINKEEERRKLIDIGANAWKKQTFFTPDIL